MVRTRASGERRQLGFHGIEGRIARYAACGRTVGPGKVAALRRDIDAENLHAGGAQNLRQDLTDQPKSDHAGRLAEFRVRLAKALHRNCADRGEGGVHRQHVFRHRHAHVLRHPIVFGVQGELVAAAGHALTDLELGGTVTDGDHDA